MENKGLFNSINSQIETKIKRLVSALTEQKIAFDFELNTQLEYYRLSVFNYMPFQWYYGVESFSANFVSNFEILDKLYDQYVQETF